MSSTSLCGRVGQLILGGFAGETLPERYARELREGRRAGAILFKRNLATLESTYELCGALLASSGGPPPFIGVDQEGGRVARLPAPALRLPPMRTLAGTGDVGLVAAAGSAVGAELAALGFNLNFAPVLDVNTEPHNPVIGDRAFGSDANAVARFALAFLNGLQASGVLACGKHFPGHGDTLVDSHHALPVVNHDRARLNETELVPFRAALGAGMTAVMSAHVIYRALDPARPGTLSAPICQRLLREELGFGGVLFSDDLEMKALAQFGSVDQVAVEAVRAGCDVVLVCSDEDAQHRAYDALVHEAERDAAFAERCREAAERVLRARRSRLARPALIADVRELVGGSLTASFTDRLARALANEKAPSR